LGGQWQRGSLGWWHSGFVQGKHKGDSIADAGSIRIDRPRASGLADESMRPSAMAHDHKPGVAPLPTSHLLGPQIENIGELAR
jgi:hypothetical protein